MNRGFRRRATLLASLVLLVGGAAAAAASASISGGENVYPAEVESVLHEHPSVADVAVVGAGDERWGEVGVAFVVLSAAAREEELLAYCRSRLAGFKVPKRVRFVDALPMSAMNKVLKDELRALDVEEVPA